MPAHRPSGASRRAWLLAAALVMAAVPVARAAAPDKDSSAKRPYVVILKNHSANAKSVANEHSRRFGIDVTMIYDRGVRGYAGSMADDDAERLAREPGVVVAPDTEVTGFEAAGSPENLSASPYYAALPTGWGWGLDRIDQHPSLAAYSEKDRYHYTETGTGVTAYIIDSGVNTNHQEFLNQVGDKRRATAAFDAYRASGTAQWGQDCNGHGTHVAGILGGRTFGVAKDVTIVSVRVLDCNGSGSVSNVVAGINYVTGQKKSNPGKPMVANMSLGGSANSALDQAVRDSIATGITYSIAAGNGNILGSGQDACNVSPARVTAALTVGATDTTDKKTSWSNYGTCVDVYAPGNNIVSSYGATTDPTAWKPLSGTSMAAPAVGGVAALLLQIDGGASPGQVSQTVATLATSNAVTNMAGAKLLYAPWTTQDISTATGRLDDPAAPPPPPPPPSSCFIICL
jgi:subtilisin family serine protease